MAKLDGSFGNYKWQAVTWTTESGRKHKGGPSAGALHNADRIVVAISSSENPSAKPRFITMHGPWDDLDTIGDIVEGYVEGPGYDEL